MPQLLKDREECVLYNNENLEALIEHFLTHEEERLAITLAARTRLPELSFERCWEHILSGVDLEWDSLLACSNTRSANYQPPDTLERTWQHIGASVGRDSTLTHDLAAFLEQSPRNASLHNLKGIESQANNPTDWAAAAHAFQKHWNSNPGHVMAGLNLAEVLAGMGQKDHAIEQIKRTLAVLDRMETLSEEVLDAPHAPSECDWFRVEWEQAAWMNAGNRDAEANAKRKLLYWQLHALLGSLTGDLVNYFQSHISRPDLPTSLSALGCALGRARRPAEAMPYLRSAYRQNPFSRSIARDYFQALLDLGLTGERQQLVQERQYLAKAAPRSVPLESWYSPVVLAKCSPPKIAGCFRITWQGMQKEVHSLALVNREICSRLTKRGHHVAFVPANGQKSESFSLQSRLTRQNRLAANEAAQPAFHISHQYPPDFGKPPGKRWIVMQHWEFGSLPRAWINPLANQVDEVWVASSFVRDCFVQSGIPARKVHVIPLGVGPAFFENQAPFPLRTKKSYRFLFVGGALHRKGIDVLLKTYHQVFSNQDDVCLVIKEFGVDSFYKGITARDRIKQFQQQPHAPEVEYFGHDASTQEIAALYTACHCLIHPYRGEGFGLPIAEAMASGLPVIVTGSGAALDFCFQDHAYLLPTRTARLSEKKIDHWETVDFPFWAEPDPDALRWQLRHVFENQEEARAKGAKARTFIQSYFTWEHTVDAVEARLRACADGPRAAPGMILPPSRKSDREHGRVSLTMIVKNEEANLSACLDSVADIVDEIIVVDTGSTDATINIAESRGAKVYHFPWIDDFAAARNEALRHASGDWIFWMDADDRLDEANRLKLRSLLADLPADLVGFVMKCKCTTDHESASTLVDHIRLFANHPDLCWKYRIHEQILLSIRRLGGKVRWSDVVIHHIGYQSEAIRRRKLERDFRLLTLENQENPDDPFTLFNLGSVFIEQKEPAKALAALERSLVRSRPTDSITRKLYSMVAQCHRFLGNLVDAKSVCQEGRKLFSDDPEILFQESIVHQRLGDKRSAIACLERLLDAEQGTYFASVDTGLRGCKGHHNLAVLLSETDQPREAERHWRLALQNEPTYLPSLVGLGELILKQKRFTDFQPIIVAVKSHPRGQSATCFCKAAGAFGKGSTPSARQQVGTNSLRFKVSRIFCRAGYFLATYCCKKAKTGQALAKPCKRF